MSLLVPPRATADRRELMDVEEGDPAEIEGALRDLRRVNRLLGGRRTTLAHLGPLLAATGRRRATVLDVAAGGGDMAAAMTSWAARRGWQLVFTVLDRHPLVVRRVGRGDGLRSKAVRGDALALPFRDGAFDLCVTSLFFHHLEPDDTRRALTEMCRVAGTGLIVNDIVRDRVAWAAIGLLTRVFTRNRLVRHDGPLSVLRAYRPGDFRRLARDAELASWGVARHFPYRMCLWGRV